MATFLDVTSLSYFTPIFVFLFSWIVVYAVLLYTRALGSNNMISVIVALLFALFVVMSDFATSVIAGVAPFLAVVFIFVVLIGIAGKMLGADIEGMPAIKSVLIVVIVLVILGGVGAKFRSQMDSSQTDTSDLSNTVNVLFHPKFIGIILIFAVAVFTIALLAKGGRH